jgi:hypothetical protein
VGSNVATTGAIIFIHEFHEGLISLLVHDKVFLHLLFDFFENDVFGEDEVFLLHVLVYFVDIAFFTFIGDGHAICQNFDNSEKIQIKLFLLLF